MNLAPASSFHTDAEAFLQGECVLVRFPMPLDIAQPDDTTLAGSAGLPPTSNARSPQHFAFIHSALLRDDASYNVTAYPVISFSHQGGAMQGYKNLPENVKPFLIPLPPLSARHATPPLFGNPLTLIGGFALGRDSWLLVNTRSFIMPENRQFKRWNPQVRLTHKQLHQIDNYRNSINQGGGGGRGGKNGGGGRGGGGRRGGGREGRRGGGVGRGEQGTFSNNSRPMTRSQEGGRGRGRGRRGQRNNLRPTTRIQGHVPSAEEGEQDIWAKLTPEERKCLVVEDVDDDSRGAHATFKDDLMLLAGPGDDGTWGRELEKLVQEEQQERDKLQKQRIARVHDWQQTVVPQS